MNTLADYTRRIADAAWFNRFIMFVILLAGVVVGIQTYGEQVADWKDLLWTLDQIILAIFLIEVVIKVMAEGDRPFRYFKDPWNVFDFSIVVTCYAALLVPEMEGAYVAVFRLARVMRVFRIVRTIPKLRLLVNTLLKSIPSIGYVGILLGVIFYIYATMGVFLFKENDPVHFGNLQRSMLSLFRVVTLEDWTDIMYINMYGCDHGIWGYGPEKGCLNPVGMRFGAAFYFVTFVMVGTMVVLNLFIGVIMNSMDEAKKDAREEADRMAEGRDLTLAEELEQITVELEELRDRVHSVSGRFGRGRKG